MLPRCLVAMSYSKASFLFGKSLAIWFSVWAVRYNAGWDYRLSSTARMVRWAVVALGYLMAASLPGPAAVRLIAGFAGLGFLCWPNFAYHLTNVFVSWPTAQGHVVSATVTDDGVLLTYAFEIGSDIYGGDSKLRGLRGVSTYAQDQPITVAYDPLNPTESRIVTSERNR